MASYQIHVNERIAVGRNLIGLLRSMPEAVSFETPAVRTKPKESGLYKKLDCAFREVKEMVDGKKPKKTLDEFLNEL
jgi:hypothetical protein